jgi:hypothetical protein
VLVYGHVRARSEAAYADFQKRRKHVRYRAYAFGGYGLIVAATLLFQLYTKNGIDAYVRVERIEFPRAASAVFIRNDSDKPWNGLRVILNGIWLYERTTLAPRDNVVVRVDRFAVTEGEKMTFPPPDTQARHLRIECDRGTFESELK